MRHEREELQKQTFGPRLKHGIVFKPVSQGLQVATIIDDLPASSANIRRGDIVTHIGGHPLLQRGCTISDERQLMDDLIIDLGFDFVVVQKHVYGGFYYFAPRGFVRDRVLAE